jgi:hypothetical protein
MIEKLLSDRVSPLDEKIREYTDLYADLWWQAGVEPPSFERTYTEQEQRAVEREMEEALDGLTERWKNRREESDWMEGLVGDIRDSAGRILRLSSLETETLFQRGFVDTTRFFVQKVKEFDPAFPVAEVYQALRNVWIMNTLQLYLDHPVQYSPSIFAYSMIYPYTDNVVDDTSVSLQDKGRLNAHLKGWLEGESSGPSLPEETAPLRRTAEKVLELIRKIEAQFAREEAPDVYRSLLAIFNAQVKSLHQQKGKVIPFESDILGISIEKGGTSVLADGFLIRGDLSESEADFCFGFGVFLQLADDIQDIALDLANGHVTIFSQTAGIHPLDKLASKLFRFTASVVDRHLSADIPREKILRDIILKNSLFLVMEAVGRHKAYFSPEYRRRIQACFPVRFGFLRRFKKQVQKTFLSANTGVVDLDFASAFLLTLASRTEAGR